MATEGIFSRVANEILESAEAVSNRLEEGLNVLLGGDVEDGGQPEPASTTQHIPSNEEMREEIKEMLKEQGENMDGIDWSELDMDGDSPLSGIADNVMGNIMKGQAGPQSFSEHLEAFRSAITWSEPFIIGLLTFQVVMFLATVYVSRKGVSLAPRIVLMILIAGIVRSAEYVNSWAGKNWESYCTQNYFDGQGVFMSIFVCAPLLFNSFIMLVMFLRESSLLLVQVKTAELKQKRKQQKKQQQGSGSGGSTGNPKRRGKKDQ